MNLEKIQELNTVNEIYEYIIGNSCSFETINKNLPMGEWFDYKNDLRVYLCNNYVRRNEAESSLDFLVVSNTKTFKFIHSTEDDIENTIQQSRVSLYYSLIDYFEGIWDNEIYKNFGFRINRNIEMFKKLFLKDNIDLFCSYLLTKVKQGEIRGLSNRILKAEKDEETGKFKTVVEYVNFSFSSFEEGFEEDKMNIENYLYEKKELEEEEKEIEVYRTDNIYSYMCENLHLLTEKQRAFIEHYSDNYCNFKVSDDFMSRELKYKYKKNIRKKLEEELLDNSNNIKKTDKGYYVLIKTNDSFLIDKILKCENKKEQFRLVGRALKRTDEVGRKINEVIIGKDCMDIFATYFNDEEEFISSEVCRFVYSKKFEEILEILKGGDKNAI